MIKLNKTAILLSNLALISQLMLPASPAYAQTPGQISLFTFSLNGSANETIASSSVLLDSASAMLAISGGSITSLSIYKDDGSGSLNAVSGNLAGSQDNINVSLPVSIPIAASTPANGKFYLTMTTDGTYNGINPASSITITTSLNKNFTIALGGNFPIGSPATAPAPAPTPSAESPTPVPGPTPAPGVNICAQQAAQTLQLATSTNQSIYDASAQNTQLAYQAVFAKADSDYAATLAAAGQTKDAAYLAAQNAFVTARNDAANFMLDAQNVFNQAGVDAQNIHSQEIAAAQNLTGKKQEQAIKKADDKFAAALNARQKALDKAQNTAAKNLGQASKALARNLAKADKNYANALKAAARNQSKDKAAGLGALNLSIKKAKAILGQSNQQALKNYNKIRC